jgi:hypothetical protein
MESKKKKWQRMRMNGEAISHFRSIGTLTTAEMHVVSSCALEQKNKK